jgi:hypothetical protein
MRPTRNVAIDHPRLESRAIEPGYAESKGQPSVCSHVLRFVVLSSVQTKSEGADWLAFGGLVSWRTHARLSRKGWSSGVFNLIQGCLRTSLIVIVSRHF